MSKKVYIETLGCAMNVRDSEHMLAELKEKENYESTREMSEADLILINTCSVREKPVHKLFSEIGGFKKKGKKGVKIGVCGCSASHLGKDIFKRAPFVDFVLGARNISKITEAINTSKFIATSIDYDESEYVFSELKNKKEKKFINISIGCNKKCAYCIVPYTRGDEISIAPDLILDEVKRAAANGAKEIFLLGQNVNNYGQKFSRAAVAKTNFTALLRMVSEIDGVQRIRFTSPHPLHMDDEFLQEFALNSKICKSMHMPLQSGSTKILKSMRRGYTQEWFLQRAKKLRELVPQASISTDIIVGFPNESDEDFAHTLHVMNEIKFEQIFSFKYSKRPNTPAVNFDGQVSDEVASQRLKTLQNRQDEILDELAKKRLNKTYDVMIEECKNGSLIGRTDNNTLVHIKEASDADVSLIGSTCRVKITNPRRLVAYGEIVRKSIR